MFIIYDDVIHITGKKHSHYGVNNINKKKHVEILKQWSYQPIHLTTNVYHQAIASDMILHSTATYCVYFSIYIIILLNICFPLVIITKHLLKKNNFMIKL